MANNSCNYIGQFMQIMSFCVQWGARSFPCIKFETKLIFSIKKLKTSKIVIKFIHFYILSHIIMYKWCTPDLSSHYWSTRYRAPKKNGKYLGTRSLSEISPKKPKKPNFDYFQKKANKSCNNIDRFVQMMSFCAQWSARSFSSIKFETKRNFPLKKVKTSKNVSKFIPF